MGDWSKVWSSTNDSNCCPSSCYNFVNPQENCGSSVTSSRATLLTGLTTNITTCAGAINYYAEQLKQRLGAQSIVVASAADTLFTLTIRMRRKNYTVTWAPANGCKFPVAVTYVNGAASGSASFQSMDQVIEWLVENLK